MPTGYGFISRVATHFFVMIVAPTDYYASECGDFPVQWWPPYLRVSYHARTNGDHLRCEMPVNSHFSHHDPVAKPRHIDSRLLHGRD